MWQKEETDRGREGGRERWGRYTEDIGGRGGRRGGEERERVPSVYL